MTEDASRGQFEGVFADSLKHFGKQFWVFLGQLRTELFDSLENRVEGRSDGHALIVDFCHDHEYEVGVGEEVEFGEGRCGLVHFREQF